ncbi:GNAT family N-acetyltransferase [Paenisporosarcina quisquiliarum]|uniref:GNAT family N-acetyltransferase n=1 Tax=Paenisporosarcina quisquiliarum TaxID=365346 RepID=UPI003734DF5D
MTVTLREVDKSNWLECTQLEVGEGQKATFPVPVVYWIAESKVDSSFVPMAIYADDLLVGFLVYGVDPDDGEYWLIALLIDQKYQRQGLGRATIRELIRHLQSEYGCTKLTLGHRPDNGEAEALYVSLGFNVVVRTESEIIRCLEFH